jgi:hypothetical protein
VITGVLDCCTALARHGISNKRTEEAGGTAAGVEEAVMSSISARGGVAALLSILIGGAAVAQTAPVPPVAPVTVPDLNQVVCEKQEVTGSRLQKKKVCRTRAEWAEMQRLDRQELDRTQQQHYMKGN